ncbi:hypothetical protein ACTFIY_008344 [Dictyostelium cf. discoideum]
MESLINSFNNLNISTIGGEKIDPATKLEHARALLSNNNKGVDLVLDLKNDIKSITYQQVEVFYRILNHEKVKLENFVQSQHGILNVGAKYSNFNRLREKIEKRIGKVSNNTELTQQQKNIIIYCLLPIKNLPHYNKNFNPDKPTGEKTFSKMLLNIAVMHSKSKFEYVLGYYDCHQETLKKLN